MKTIKDQTFGGERPLFASRDTRFEHITITTGESGLKQCHNIECDHCGALLDEETWWDDKDALTTQIGRNAEDIGNEV